MANGFYHLFGIAGGAVKGRLYMFQFHFSPPGFPAAPQAGYGLKAGEQAVLSVYHYTIRPRKTKAIPHAKKGKSKGIRTKVTEW